MAGFFLYSSSFPAIYIQLAKGTVAITGSAEKETYIQGLQLNGQPYHATWLPWEKIQRGAKLHFDLSATPSKSWGTALPPPSFN